MTYDPWFDKNTNENHKDKSNDVSWERKILEKVATAAIKEQRRSRRWGIFFKFLFFLYITLLIFILIPSKQSEDIGENHVALVKLHGVIDGTRDANAEDINKSLRTAFEADHAKAVILHINSPGGSPVQSNEIYKEIMQLRKANPEKKVYAVIGDAGASGAYYVAASADQIYANESSIVGSIGVIMEGFGFVDTLEKVGMTRRVITSGKNKGMLDPFKPENDTEQAFVQNLLDIVHDQFINAVKEGRGARLKNDPDIFSGLFWTGKQSVELGLIDGIGSVDYVAKQVIGIEKMVDYSVEKSFFERFSTSIGQTMTDTFLSRTGITHSTIQF